MTNSLTGVADPMSPPAIEALIDRYPEQRMVMDGHTLAYRTAGTGPTMVLLHGIGSGAASWVHQLEGLSKRFRVVAWDAPGYGESEPLATDSPDAGDYAAALTRFCDALALERIVLVGQSMGAIIATRLAAVQPERLRGLALLSPARGYGSAPIEEREQRLRERVAALTTMGPAAHAASRAQRHLSNDPSPSAKALIEWNMRRLSLPGYAQAAHLLSHGDISVDAARYGGRVLVLSGAADRLTPEAGCRDIATLFSDATYRSLGAVGHASYAEAPAAVNALITDFALGLPR